MSMKNGDMPAHPTGEVYFVGEDGKAKATQSHGMTKREMMAMHIFSARLSRDGFCSSREGDARESVELADILLAELEKSK